MDHELILVVGRMEGKLDTLVSLQTTQNERIRTLENRAAAVENRITIVETEGNSNKHWWLTLGSIFAALVAAIASLLSGYFNSH